VWLLLLLSRVKKCLERTLSTFVIINFPHLIFRSIHRHVRTTPLTRSCCLKNKRQTRWLPQTTTFAKHARLFATGNEKPSSKSSWYITKLKQKFHQFKQKKAQYVVQYGGSFIFVHETLGISSYVVVYSLLSAGIIDIEGIATFFGWSEGDLQSYGISLHGSAATLVAVYAIVKGLDVMGLVPLRWALCFTITPFVARYVAPYVDTMFVKGRKFVNKDWKAK